MDCIFAAQKYGYWGKVVEISLMKQFGTYFNSLMEEKKSLLESSHNNYSLKGGKVYCVCLNTQSNYEAQRGLCWPFNLEHYNFRISLTK